MLFEHQLFLVYQALILVAREGLGLSFHSASDVCFYALAILAYRLCTIIMLIL